MKNWLNGTLAAVTVAVVAVTSLGLPQTVEAKRLGGGSSQGMSRNMPARTAPDAPPPKPATPNNASPAATPGAAAAPAAAAGKRSWMGPLAGLAAGLGLAALFSHLGMGEGLANFVMIALLAAVAFFVIRFLIARFAGGGARGPALAGANAGGMGGNNTNWREPAPLQREALPAAAPQPSAFDNAPAVAATAATSAAAAGVTAAFVPAAFDSEGFARIAKMIFIRMQTANDAGDLNDLRRFTTPEMFAAVRLELQERGSKVQATDVQKVEAKVLDVAEENDRQIVSVRFSGQVVEEAGAAPTSFDEVWHLVKSTATENNDWAIAGIEQMA